MPRKTRKQKEKAQIKRFGRPAPRSIEGDSSGVVKGEFSFDISDLSREDFEPVSLKKGEKSATFSPSGFAPRDLIKSVLLTCYLVVVELVIYWLWFKE